MTEITRRPRAIAEIIAMPPGTRPLRRPVHPRFIPQTAINEVSRRTQLEWLGESSAGPWVKEVLDRGREAPQIPNCSAAGQAACRKTLQTGG